MRATSEGEVMMGGDVVSADAIRGWGAVGALSTLVIDVDGDGGNGNKYEGSR
jgi:hypothetical protein